MDAIEHPKVEAFLADIFAVCRKHGMALSHQDDQGGFIIEKTDKRLLAWLDDATIGRSLTK